MRQNFKDKKYYNSLIEEINNEVKIILNEEQSFIDNGVDYNKEFINMEIFSNQFLIFNLKYTSGDKLEEFIKNFNSILKSYIKSIDITHDLSDGGDLIYSELLRIVSISIILEFNGFSTPINDLSQVLNKLNFNDKLISLILKNYNIIISKNLYWSNDTAVKLLVNILEETSDIAIENLKYYLEKVFYSKENLEDAYDSHKSNKGYTFSGYWSWEAGAIVKIMGLDDSSFKDNLYYPYDIVHFKD